MSVVPPSCFLRHSPLVLRHSLATPKPGEGGSFVILYWPERVSRTDRTDVLQRPGSSASSQYDWHLERGDNFRKFATSLGAL